MLISLLGSLLGFGTSFLPKVMDYFQDRQDKAHELAMMRAQAEVQERIEHVRLQAVHVEAQAGEVSATLQHSETLQKRASQWVVNLAATVRPFVTYLFFLEFAVLTVSLVAGWLTEQDYNQIWDDETQALFATIVSFWFGNRLFGRRTST